MLPAPAISPQHIHPILVNFTAGLVPASIASDLIGRSTRKTTFHHAAWWMLCFAAAITPFTAAAGFLWKQSVQAVTPADLLLLHQWLGIGLTAAFVGLAVWRGLLHHRNVNPGVLYFVVACTVLLALIYQGSIGGLMAFGP